MPLPSEVETSVLFVSVSTRVTVAPGTTAPVGSVTVPRKEARYCAWLLTEKAIVARVTHKKKRRSGLFMASLLSERSWGKKNAVQMQEDASRFMTGRVFSL
jgi:hypothetical protein